MIRPRSYQVLLTPLVARNEYGNELDVTGEFEIDDYVKSSGITSIKQEVDNGDFDFGVFVYDSINLTCFNINGRFAPPTDSRSIFTYSRDKAKIKINFFDGENEDAAISFDGLVDERASRMNFKNDEIRFKVLSLDSILNRIKVPAGSISNGTLISTAIENILQLPEIASVLNYDEANINVQEDYNIDDGSFFDNLIIKDALDEMLKISGSTLIVEKISNDIFVRSRKFNDKAIFKFFGPGDIFQRENIVDVSNYNDGLHRAFNTITVGNVSVSNQGLIEANGDNEKSISLEWITNPLTLNEIASDLLDEWKTPKIELTIRAKTSEVKSLEFFDLVSINYPYKVTPFESNPLPIYGVQRYGSAVYPNVQGNLKIGGNAAFKVVGISENPNSFLTRVKLRQVGRTFSDGYFSDIAVLYGSAVYGLNEYQLNESRIDPNYMSHYGAASYGVVQYGNE